jgi:uncharacterized membrane protein YozB (DUF420 family)
MIDISDLPKVNATLNSISFILLCTGYGLIRAKRVTAHRRCMTAAFCVSVLFLVSYLTYRFFGSEKKFSGTGWVRLVYFFILVSHVILAATVPVLASITLYRGYRGPVEKHRRIARITFPIWTYVSVTGVIVYVMLFRLYGPLPESGSGETKLGGATVHSLPLPK